MSELRDRFCPGELDGDPVALQICWSRLVAIMDEVDIALVRASFSTIVGETRDFAVVLLDSQARSIAQSQMSSPGFTCSLPFATRAMLAVFPPETLAPGDALITNDPWLCHGHLTDLIIVVPLFAGPRPIAYVATAAHVSDIGGRLDERCGSSCTRTCWPRSASTGPTRAASEARKAAATRLFSCRQSRAQQ